MILITNDDGYWTDELYILYKIAKKLDNEVVIVAPNKDCSGVGCKQHTYEVKYFKNPRGYTLDGTPIDCIKFGLKRYNPDLVLSGINRGLNIGDVILNESATFNAVKYASEQGIKSLAISKDNLSNIDYNTIKKNIFKTLKYNFKLANLNLVNEEIILTKIGNIKYTFLIDKIYDNEKEYEEGTDLDIVFNKRKSSLTIIN